MAAPLILPPIRPSRRTARDDRHLPAALESLPLRPRIVYTRKSSEDKQAQARSHDQQLYEITRHFELGADDIARHFRDDKSGKNFDEREGFMEMVRWCERNWQPAEARGTILMWDRSRFGRALDEDGEVDYDAYDEYRIRLKKAGWLLAFVNEKDSGNRLIDRFLGDVSDTKNAEYLQDLKRNVSRGKRDAVRLGFYPGGPTPFGCFRAEAAGGRILREAARDERGVVIRDADGKAVEPAERVRRVILKPNPEQVAHWTQGVRMLLRGASVQDVLRYFDAKVPTARGYTRWERKSLLRALTNERLIGLQPLMNDETGEVEHLRAQWDPIVDPELYKALIKELTRRKLLDSQERTPRAESSTYVIRNMYCAHCGVRYTGGVANHTGHRYYTHPEVKAGGRIDRETEARAKAAGCRTYRVRADHAEHALRDLILQERCSEAWAETLERIMSDTNGAEAEARAMVDAMETALADAKRGLANLTAALRAKRSLGPTAAAIMAEQIDDAAAEVERATVNRDAALERLKQAGTEFKAVRTLLDESKALAEAWDTGDLADRERILAWWVRGVFVRCDNVPVKTKWRAKQGATAVQKTLFVFLGTRPNDPTPVELPVSERGGGALPDDRRKATRCSSRNDTETRSQPAPEVPSYYTVTIPGQIRTPRARPLALV